MNGMVHDTLCSCLESITVSDEAQSSFAAWGGSTSTCLMSVPVCEYEPALRAWFDFFLRWLQSYQVGNWFCGILSNQE